MKIKANEIEKAKLDLENSKSNLELLQRKAHANALIEREKLAAETIEKQLEYTKRIAKANAELAKLRKDANK